MKAVLWPFKYADMRISWSPMVADLIAGLHGNGITVKRHPKFVGMGFDDLPVYDHSVDNPADICIYNHATQADLLGNILKADHNWFWKPSGPTKRHATLDTWGYGPYSSITYQKPAFEDFQIAGSHREDWKRLVSTADTKWGNIIDRVAARILAKAPPTDMFKKVFWDIAQEVKELVENMSAEAAEKIKAAMMQDLAARGVNIVDLSVSIAKFRGHPYVTSAKLEISGQFSGETDERLTNLLTYLQRVYSPKYKLKSVPHEGGAMFNVR